MQDYIDELLEASDFEFAVEYDDDVVYDAEDGHF